MTSNSVTTEQLAEQIRGALQSADLDAYRELLDPNVVWGPPDDPSWGCHSRDEVLAWYRRGRARGMRANVTETVVIRDRILVGLQVHGDIEAIDDRGAANRWQVLTIVAGRVSEIRGFEDRDEAVRRLTR